MKYEYITFRKQLPSGKWESDPNTPVRIFNSKKAAMDEITDRHAHKQGLGWAGHYDIESVTRIHNGGESKGTESFLHFFDYTMAPGNGKNKRIRYREAIAPLVSKA